MRVLAHAVLRNLNSLISEGLDTDAVEQATAHALALTSEVISLDDQPERQRMHRPRALWELLDVLSGPVSSELPATGSTRRSAKPRETKPRETRHRPRVGLRTPTPASRTEGK